MKIILGGRASRKTTKLIQESAKTGCRILTFNKESARGIYDQAMSLRYDIPVPLTVKDLKQLSDYSEEKAEIKRRGIIIDELEATLSALCGAPVHSATFCCADMPLIIMDSQGNMKMFSKGE